MYWRQTGLKYMRKTVLITGVASGIGLAQARMFLENGYTVYGVDKQAMTQTLTGDFTFIQMDVTQDLTALTTKVPTVDILCNTAGVLDGYKPLLDITDEEIHAVLDVNFFAHVRITRHYLQNMVARQQGVIINMCSIASSLAGGGGAAYTSSKHALAGFTKQVALDYAKDGVLVVGIAPGAVQTGMTQADFEPGGLAEWVAEQTPIKRWSQPEEIAELTWFLANGNKQSFQGAIITMDGGWSIK